MEEDRKRIIGLYGEMCLAMELHRQGWQVYRAYIDEQIDFIIAQYYCQKCCTFSTLEKRQTGDLSFPINRCAKCCRPSLKIATRFIQVKASVGKPPEKIKKYPKRILNGYPNSRGYSFHAKLRSNVDENAFYVWIAFVYDNENLMPHFYIFHHKEIDRFDDLSLDSYQKTDNQKTTLFIDTDGTVLNGKGTKHNFDCFNSDFYKNFGKLLNERYELQHID